MGYKILNFRSLFIVSILISIILLVIAYFISKSEENEFRQDQEIFHYALQLVEENQTKLALQLLTQLEEKYPANHLVMWQKGWAHAQSEEQLDQALEYFLKAQELNPVLTREPIFLIQFSWVLISKNYYGEARAYLEHSKKQMELSEEHTKLVDSWLEYIELQLASTLGG